MKVKDFICGMMVGAAAATAACCAMGGKKCSRGKMSKVVKGAEDIAQIIMDAFG